MYHNNSGSWVGIKVLRSIYRAYFDLKSRFERVQSAYDREVSKNSSLSARIYEVCTERDSLKGQVMDYARIKWAFGPEEVERAVEEVKRQETAEKEQRKAKRKFSRG